MKILKIWIYLKLTKLFGVYPSLETREDFVLFSNGPLKNLSFMVIFKDEGDKLAYNHQIILIPKLLENVVPKLHDLIDSYICYVIDSEIKKIERNHTKD